MKTIFACILALVYVATTVGTGLHLPYCMDEPVSAGLAEEDLECCKDVLRQVKLKQEKVITEARIHHPRISCETTFFNYNLTDFAPFREEYPVTHTPPGIAAVSLFVLHCVFRI